MSENKSPYEKQEHAEKQGESQASDTTSQASAAPPAAAKPKRARGLAAADPETRRAVARKGGEAVSRNRRHMADIGRKGGEAVSQDRKHMASIGRKGGEAVSQNREHMAEIGRKGGEARGSRPEGGMPGSRSEDDDGGNPGQSD